MTELAMRLGKLKDYPPVPGPGTGDWRTISGIYKCTAATILNPRPISLLAAMVRGPIMKAETSAGAVVKKEPQEKVLLSRQDPWTWLVSRHRFNSCGPWGGRGNPLHISLRYEDRRVKHKRPRLTDEELEKIEKFDMLQQEYELLQVAYQKLQALCEKLFTNAAH